MLPPRKSVDGQNGHLTVTNNGPELVAPFPATRQLGTWAAAVGYRTSNGPTQSAPTMVLSLPMQLKLWPPKALGWLGAEKRALRTSGRYLLHNR